MRTKLPARTRRRASRLGSAILLAVVACTRGPKPEGGAIPSPTMITHDELVRVNAQTAYDAVQKLRPALLKNRGRTSILGPNIQTPMVYLDDQLLGPIDRLRDVEAQTLDSIRYLSASEAQFKWGSGHPAGVLLLLTRR